MTIRVFHVLHFKNRD